MRNKLVGGLVVAFAGLFAAAGNAGAAVLISSMTAAPDSAQAGAHSNFHVNLTFGNGEHPRNLTLHLPAGLIGDPSAATPCAIADFQAGSCTAASAVGTSSITATANGFIPVSTSDSDNVFLLAHDPSQTALLGIELNPTGSGLLTSPIFKTSEVRVRDTTDSGLDSVLTDLPNSAPLLGGITTADVVLNTLSLTLNASASHGSFETNPTSCGVDTTTVDVTSYEDPAPVSRSASFTTTGCDHVPFTPSLTVTPDTTRPNANAGFSVKLSVPGGDTAGVRQSHVSSTVVKLPVGVGLNPGLAGALTACTDGEFGLGSHAPSMCPSTSQIGTVALDTPVVGTIIGQVYLGQPTPNALLRLFVVVNGPGFLVKLTGTNTLDPVTGQVTATFAGLPQIPFTAFTLNFNGGDHSVLTTPPTCGPATTTATLTPYSGAAPVSVNSTFDVSADGAGAPCGAQPFAPTLNASTDPTQAGAATTNTIVLTRHDSDQLLKDVTVSLPPGVAGSLKGVPICPDVDANAGTCPADTRVGVVSAQAGVGPAPLAIHGNVYLAGPGGGALARLAIVLPGNVGPFDFGNVVSFAGLSIRRADAGLDVVTKNLPTALDGIPLNLRQIAFSLNRPGFALNATSCAPMTIKASFVSTAGATATATAPYQATGCDKLKFAPKAGVTLSGDLHANGDPKIATAVTEGPGQAAAKSVQLTLPAGLVAAPGRVIACSQDDQANDSCPANSVIGDAVAQTPLLPIPLTSKVYFAQRTDGPIPGLHLVLAPLGIRVDGRTSASTTSTAIITTFDGLPDTPLSSFALTFSGASHGVLSVQPGVNFCAKTTYATGVFTAQNGAHARTKTAVSVIGCPPRASIVLSHPGTGRARLVLKVARVHGGSALTQVRFTLPRSVSVARWRTSQRSVSPGKGARLRRVSSRVLSLTLPKKGAPSVSIVLRGRVVHAARRGARTVVVRTVDTTAKATTQRVALRR